MAELDRYPTWVLLLAASALTVAAIVRFRVLDRRPNPLLIWFMLLAGCLAVALGLAVTGLLRTRSGQRFTPNEGLLTYADLVAGMLVVSIPLGRAMRRLTDGEVRQLRAGNAIQRLFGGNGPFVGGVIVAVITAALMTGELALAAALPPPPAVAACQDYTTWLLAPANVDVLPPTADQGILARAARVAPPGPLRVQLRQLVATVQAEPRRQGSSLLVTDNEIASGLGAVNHDCTSVPVGG